MRRRTTHSTGARDSVPCIVFLCFSGCVRRPPTVFDSSLPAAFDAELRAKLAESDIEVATSSPEELQQLIAHDIKVLAERVKVAGLVAQQTAGSLQ